MASYGPDPRLFATSRLGRSDLHRTPRERGMLRHPHGARRYRLPGARHPAVSVRAHGQPGDCRAQRKDDRRPTAPAAPDRERAAAAVGVRSLLGAFAPGWTALRQAAPGVCIAIALAAVARGVAHALAQGVGGLPQIPLSPVMCAVLLGMGWRNSIGVPAWASSGLNWAMYRLLRAGSQCRVGWDYCWPSAPPCAAAPRWWRWRRLSGRGTPRRRSPSPAWCCSAVSPCCFIPGWRATSWPPPRCTPASSSAPPSTTPRR